MRNLAPPAAGTIGWGLLVRAQSKAFLDTPARTGNDARSPPRGFSMTQPRDGWRSAWPPVVRVAAYRRHARHRHQHRAAPSAAPRRRRVPADSAGRPVPAGRAVSVSSLAAAQPRDSRDRNTLEVRGCKLTRPALAAAGARPRGPVKQRPVKSRPSRPSVDGLRPACGRSCA